MGLSWSAMRKLLEQDYVIPLKAEYNILPPSIESHMTKKVAWLCV